MTAVISRRALISRLALFGMAGGGLWLVRDRLPGSGPQIRFDDGHATPWLPIVAKGPLLEIQASVNGRPVRALIDSGAQVSAVDRALAAELALPRTTTLPFLAYGVSGAASLTHTVGLDLALPGFAAAGLRAAVFDIAALAGASGRSFRVLVGRDVLNHVRLEVDMTRRRLRLARPNDHAPPRDATVVGLRPQGGAPMVEVRINGGRPIAVLLDTGAQDVLALAAPAASTAGLSPPSAVHTVTASVGLGGVALNTRLQVRTLSVGGVTLRDAPVAVYPPARRSGVPSGLLGAGFLQRFGYVLDLPDRRLLLTPPNLMIVPPPGEPNR